MSKAIEALTGAAIWVLGSVFVCLIAVHTWSHVELVATVSAQTEPSTTKTILINRLRRLDPIEVDQVLEDAFGVAPTTPSEDDLMWVHMGHNLPIRGREFREAYKFQAGDDWLRKLSLLIKNRTSKEIVYISLTMKFPQTKAEGPMVEDNIAYGHIPDAVAFNGKGEKLPQVSNQPLSVGPDQEIALALAEHESEIRVGLERVQPFSTISLCYIEYELYFADGMAWWLGRYMAPVPTQPGKFVAMDMQYFPAPVHGLPGN